MIVRAVLLAILFSSSLARAADKPTSIPYLGPGTDVMSKEEYQRVYKNYIQLSALLGYPFLEGNGPACDHDLRSIFRQSGFFGYPVPADAEEVKKAKFSSGSYFVESYELGGISIQVLRDGKTKALDRLILVNAITPKAKRKLSQLLRKEILSLDRDTRTGLEKVAGLPVGFPHPLLTQESQGLYVKILKFNGKLDGCAPLAYLDNTWVGGFNITDTGCHELQDAVEQVWTGHLTAKNFAASEVQKMRDHAMKQAMSHGISEAEAAKIVAKNIVEPFTADVNVIGNAMRNLAQCNSLALGSGKKSPGGSEQESPNKANSTPTGSSAK